MGPTEGRPVGHDLLRRRLQNAPQSAALTQRAYDHTIATIYLITSHPGRRKGERQVVIVEGRCIFIGAEGGRGREGRTSFEVEYLSFGLVVVASQHEKEQRVGDDTEN